MVSLSSNGGGGGGNNGYVYDKYTNKGCRTSYGGKGSSGYEYDLYSITSTRIMHAKKSVIIKAVLATATNIAGRIINVRYGRHILTSTSLHMSMEQSARRWVC